MLKQRCAARTANQVPRRSTGPLGPSTVAKAAPTTTLGSTNGTTTSVRSGRRPGNRNRDSAHATGTPTTTVITADTTA